MPLCLPLLVIATLHTGVIDDAPLLCAAMRHLLNRELCHRKLGTYTGCLAYREHNRPERASCDGGTGELWKLQERTELTPQRLEA